MGVGGRTLVQMGVGWEVHLYKWWRGVGRKKLQLRQTSGPPVFKLWFIRTQDLTQFSYLLDPVPGVGGDKHL